MYHSRTHPLNDLALWRTTSLKVILTVNLMETQFSRSPNTPTLAAIVLAGGQSSRLGQDKALLSIQGQPLLRRTCAIAQRLTNQVFIVTPWPERYQTLVPAGCQFVQEQPLPGTALPNFPKLEETGQRAFPPTQPHGPLVGFAQGLAPVKADWVLLLACDLPYLQVEVLQDWITQLSSVPADAIANLHHSEKGWEPLCGFYRRTCLPRLTDFIAQGGRSFQAWLSQQPVQILNLPDPQMLYNCNTPQDLAHLDDSRVSSEGPVS